MNQTLRRHLPMNPPSALRPEPSESPRVSGQPPIRGAGSQDGRGPLRGCVSTQAHVPGGQTAKIGGAGGQAPPEQREVRSEGGPFPLSAFRFPACKIFNSKFEIRNSKSQPIFPLSHLPLSAQSKSPRVSGQPPIRGAGSQDGRGQVGGGQIKNPKSKIPASLTPSPLNPLTPRRRPAAFTLIELMVAAAITSLLILGMTGIFDQSMKAWRLSSRRADSEREVRAAMATLERDLGGLVVGNSLPIYLGQTQPTLVGISTTNFLNLAPMSATGAWSNVSTTLFFASTQRPDPTKPGDVAGVGYYVAWDQACNAGRGGYNLYRYFQPPEAFFGNMAGFVQKTSSLFPMNSLDEIVGANVLNFWAQLVTVPAGLTAGPSQLPNQAIVTQRPSYIQLELTAYGSEAVRNFNTREDWGNTNNIKKFGRSFIWRVDL